jgi:acyl carrier protein
MKIGITTMVTGRQDVYNKVVAIIAEQLNISKDTIEPASRLESLGADSLDQVEIVMKLEEEFNIEINDQDAEKIVTVDDAVRYILKLMEH